MAFLPTVVRATAPKVARSALQRRALSDIHITRTGKPIVRIQGGRSSLGEYTATVFGATGQLGRYIVNRLARQGCTVVVPYREEMAKRHLKLMGDLGRVVFIEYDLHNTQSIEESIRHSDVVYNLVGRNYPTKNFSLEDVHIEGAERIAEAVAKYDVDRFIHVSSYNANPKSTSEFFSTKGRAEHVVRSIFPETTIVRPAPMFGFEDNLLQKYASVTNLFTSNNLQEKYWPVHVIDVGEALEKMCYDDNTASQTFELYGPKQYSSAEIAELVDREIFKKRRHINVPKPILKPVAGLLNRLLWWDVMSADEIEREFHDQVIDESAKTFKDLGIEPSDLSKWTYHYLQSFRSSTYWDLPPATEKEKREDKKMANQDSDDELVLSSSALDALKEFYSERDARAEQFAKLQAKAEEQHASAQQQPLSMDVFTEDWNESQFWYSDECASFLARQLLEGATADTTIAVVSAPSVFVQLKNILNAASEDEPKPKLVLLEHDNRFAVFPEFHFYDFAQPLKLPAELKGSCDRIICDPPFLSEDCQTKAAMTVQWMSKPAPAGEKPRLIVCTGERMESLVTRLYKSFGLQTTDYDPVHARGLSNEFYCYANFKSLGWKWRGEKSQ
ncbi:NADH-ubiquinone oxidoreductase 40 kDa subunit [Podospora australis]|uniref:Protein-lysine N-methyltransferase EFM5 n=1 Tax=Podospora australis TaxID=1536484 RepID=A0AAN6WUN3_9PEZI|nr:NADH-ubiquinone oxidoreductase 40 kDa subunit [Podospora australis]